MRPVRSFLCLCALIFPGILPATAVELENPSFETPGSPPPGWSTMIGAQNATTGPASSVRVEAGDARKGERRLVLSGDSSTLLWNAVYQDVPVTAGTRVVCKVAVRGRGIRREAKQYENGHAALAFVRGGKMIRLLPATTIHGDQDWGDVTLHAIAPQGAETARIFLFLSMSGTLEFDDVRLTTAPAAPFDAAVRAGAYDALHDHVRRTYPFFGIAGRPADPDPLFRHHRKKALSAKNERAFVAECSEVLRALNDLHVSIHAPWGKTYLGPRNERPPNLNFDVVDRALEKTLASGNRWKVARLAAGPGYVRIDTLVLSPQDRKTLLAALDLLADAPSLMIDLRANGGGDENFAKLIAGRFVGKDTRYALSLVRDPFSPELRAFRATTRVLAPVPGREPDPRPVVVLQGPYCVSSTEGFLLMWKAIPTATTVGLASRGASANPRPFDLLPGVTVHCSTWQAHTLDGECIEGIGVRPDVEVKVPPTRYRTADPTFEKGLEILLGK